MSEIPTPAASVVIAAHDEEHTIGRCLEALAQARGALHIDVVVAANGCRDATAEIARGFDGITVLELAAPSKVGALNAADDVAQAFPRIYLDADVVLDSAAVTAMVRTLHTDAALLAAPAVRYETSHSHRVVQAFYHVLRQVRAGSPLLVGRGVYGLSRAGRDRFERFPDMQGDDYFVARLFSRAETVVTAGLVIVWAPRSWADLLRIRTRIAAGNAELTSAHPAVASRTGNGTDLAPTTTGTLATLAALARREPHRIPSVLVFLLVTVIARLRARWADTSTWHRDTSSR